MGPKTIIFYKNLGGGRMCVERNRLKSAGIKKKMKVWAFIKSMCTMYKLD